MSLELKLLQLAAENKKSATMMIIEFYTLLEIQEKYNAKYFKGRESHLKVLAYRNLKECYGGKNYEEKIKC